MPKPPRPAPNTTGLLDRVARTAQSAPALDEATDHALDPAERTHTAYRADGHCFSVYYGPGQSVRIVAREHLTGPIITGATLPAAQVTPDAVRALHAQVTIDVTAIRTARASHRIAA